MLTVVMSLAMQSLSRNEDPAAFGQAFMDRLHALSRTYEALSRENWSEVPLQTIVQQELSPFSEQRVTIKGPRILLQPKPALSFGMILHELATNAAKYGALSGDRGQVAVRWGVQDGHLQLHWAETKGPAVQEPKRRGFGSELLEQEVQYGLDGRLQVSFEKSGVQFKAEIPLDAGISTGRSGGHERDR
jgi:two-component system CheB/CheR fusion protein